MATVILLPGATILQHNHKWLWFVSHFLLERQDGAPTHHKIMLGLPTLVYTIMIYTRLHVH